MSRFWKRVLWIFFLVFFFGGVGVVIRNAMYPQDSVLWLPLFLIAAAIALYYVWASGVDWEDRRDGYTSRRGPPPQQNGGDQQFAAAVGNAGAWLARWVGNAAVAAVNNHGWLIAGILLAIGTFWYGKSSSSTGFSWTMIVILFLATCFAFLAYTGNLGKFLVETGRNHLAKAWLVISLVVAVLLWKYADDDGFTFWEMSEVWIALASAAVAGLIVLDLLKPLLTWAGGVISKAYGFGYHPFLSLVLWGLTLLFGYAFAVKGAFNVFDDFEISQGVYDVLKWVGAVGFFILIFSPLVFKKK